MIQHKFKILMIILVLSLTTIAQSPVLVADQGANLVYQSNGTLVDAKDLTVSVWDSPTGGNLLYAETFTNAISNGAWNVMLGNLSTNQLNLTFGTIYYKDYNVSSEDLSFLDNFGNTLNRQPWQSPLGLIQPTSINVTNLTFWDDLGIILQPKTSTDTLRIGAGNTTTAAYAFSTDADTGSYLAGVGVYGITVAGNPKVQVNANQFNILEMGLANLPSLVIGNDVDSGWYRIAANHLGLTLGGVKRFEITTSIANFTVPNVYINSTERLCTSENGLCNQTSNVTGFWIDVSGTLFPNASQPISLNGSSILNVSSYNFRDQDITIRDAGSTSDNILYEADNHTFDCGDCTIQNFRIFDIFGSTMLQALYNGSIGIINGFVDYNANLNDMTNISIVSTENLSVNSNVVTALNLSGNNLNNVRYVEGRPITGTSLVVQSALNSNLTSDVCIASSDEAFLGTSNVNRACARSGSINPDWDFLTNVDMNGFNISNMGAVNLTINENLDMNNFNITNVSTILFGPSNTISVDGSTGDFRVTGGNLVMGNNDISGVDLLSATRLEAGFGSAILNSFAFTGDSDTGMFHAFTNIIGFSAGGINVANMSSTELNITTDLNLNADNFLNFDNGGILKSITYNSTMNALMVMRDSNNVSFLFSPTGSNTASYMPRSMMIGGDLGGGMASNLGNCTAQGYNHIDCATDTTGADLGIENELEVKDNVYIGNAVNYTEISANGTISLFGSARVIKEAVFNPLQFDNSAGTPASRGILSNTPALLYDATTSEHAAITFEIPEDIDLTVDPFIELHFAPVAGQTTGSTFVFQAEIRYIGNGESVSKAIDETSFVNLTASNTAFILGEGDLLLTGSLMAAGDHISVGLDRVPGNVNDDRNGDAGILLLEFIYTSNRI